MGRMREKLGSEGADCSDSDGGNEEVGVVDEGKSESGRRGGVTRRGSCAIAKELGGSASLRSFSLFPDRHCYMYSM